MSFVYLELIILHYYYNVLYNNIFINTLFGEVGDILEGFFFNLC